MSGTKITPRMKYQEELDLQFGREIVTRPGGEDLYGCIQCGTCSSTCPLSLYMDFTPRKVIALTRAGFKDEVLSCNTIWLCASCYACTVECPKEIRITDVMYVLKRKAIEQGVYPPRFPIPVLANEFFKSVQKTGRSNEGRIVARMFLKTRPWKLLRNMGLGLKLLFRGRMAVKTERMPEGQEQLQTLLDRAGQLEREARASMPTAAAGSH